MMPSGGQALYNFSPSPLMCRFYFFTFTISTVKWLLHLWTLSHLEIFFYLEMNIIPNSAYIILEVYHMEGKYRKLREFLLLLFLVVVYALVGYYPE